MHDTVIVELLRDERIAEFSEPQFQEGRKHGRVVEPIERVVPFVDAEFEVGDSVAISWHSKDPFGFGTAERENAVGEERENDGDFEVRVSAFLQPVDHIERLSENRGMERCIL